jgi:hypothetical protein
MQGPAATPGFLLFHVLFSGRRAAAKNPMVSHKLSFV